MIHNILHKVLPPLLRTQSSRTYVRGARRPSMFTGFTDKADPAPNKMPVDEIDFDAEDLSQYDTDLATSHKSHKQFEREQSQYQQNIRLWTVGQKYFRHKLPNFLTWAEKQQIRFLHNKDPVDWNCDRLAECFPATTDTIAQVCKSNWQPKDDKRIERHDTAARHTWQLFRSNEIADLPPALVEHLRKFSNRSEMTAIQPAATSTTKQQTRLPAPATHEFSSLITASSIRSQSTAKRSRNKTGAEEVLPAKIAEDETYLLGEIVDKRPTTFRPSADSEQAWLTAGSLPQNPSGTGVIASSNPFRMQKFDAPECDEEDVLKRLSVPAIREHIQIPYRLRKEGATYKMGDCYYDDDGEFLYRVPGMTGSK